MPAGQVTSRQVGVGRASSRRKAFWTCMLTAALTLTACGQSGSVTAVGAPLSESLAESIESSSSDGRAREAIEAGSVAEVAGVAIEASTAETTTSAPATAPDTSTTSTAAPVTTTAPTTIAPTTTVTSTTSTSTTASPTTTAPTTAVAAAAPALQVEPVKSVAPDVLSLIHI